MHHECAPEARRHHRHAPEHEAESGAVHAEREREDQHRLDDSWNSELSTGTCIERRASPSERITAMLLMPMAVSGITGSVPAGIRARARACGRSAPIQVSMRPSDGQISEQQQPEQPANMIACVARRRAAGMSPAPTAGATAAVVEMLMPMPMALGKKMIEMA